MGAARNRRLLEREEGLGDRWQPGAEPSSLSPRGSRTVVSSYGVEAPANGARVEWISSQGMSGVR
jgi:hypothetical protein